MKVLVTGGTGGLGEAIVSRLTNDGHELVFTYNQSTGKASEMEETYAGSKAVQCNFQLETDVDKLVELVASEDISCIVNNAISEFETNHFHKISTGSVTDGLMNNVLPTVRLMQGAVKIFRKKKFGKFVTILTSGVVGVPPTGYSTYTAEKAYLASISKSIVGENNRFNITSNCVSPSFMQTKLTGGVDERMVEAMEAAHPLKSLLKVEEVAEQIAFLVAAPQQINGVNIPINAGVNVI